MLTQSDPAARPSTATQPGLPLPEQQAAFFAQFPFVTVEVAFQARQSGLFGPYIEPAIRGALGQVLLAQNCVVDPSACWVCEEVPYCTLQCLFGDGSPDQGTAPFILSAPPCRQLTTGTVFSFFLTLFGRSIDLVPAVCRAMELVASQGLKNGQIPCAVRSVCLVNEGVVTPAIKSCSSLTLQFVSPLRLKKYGGYVSSGQLDFGTLWKRLKGRLVEIGSIHCGMSMAELAFPPEPRTIRVVYDNLGWTQGRGHRTFRQQQKNSLNGLKGSITFSGDLDPYLPYLRLGEITHVGSGCVQGLGKYRVVIEE